MNTYEGELLNKKFDPEVEVNFGTSKQKCIHVYVQKKERIEILNKEELQKREDKDTYR